MNTYRKELWYVVPERQGVINITSDVQEVVRSSGILEGLCLVNAMNVTSSVFINDDEEGLQKDFMEWLEKLAPYDANRQVHSKEEDASFVDL